jgi:signal transduction histidine kinase
VPNPSFSSVKQRIVHDSYLDCVFDKTTSLALEICASAFSQLRFNFVDKKWQESSSDSTINVDEHTAIIDFVLSQKNLIEVSDLAEDSRFSDNNFIVNGQVIRHFAAIPLILSESCVIGMISVMDIKPKKLSVHQKSIFRLLARDVISHLNQENKTDLLEGKVELHKIVNDKLDEFTYMASHDLKSPLNAIKNLMSWVEEDANNGITEDNPKYFKMINKRIDRMQLILQGLECYSKVGRNDGTPEHISLKALVNECCELLNIAENFEVEIDDIEVELPKTPLQLILNQLLANAAMHHDKGHGIITVRCKEDDCRYQLSVKDDGPGIAIELQDKIFKPFQKLKPKDELESNGLGLAMAKKALEPYAGSIMVTSQIGLGAIFTIIWPK